LRDERPRKAAGDDRGERKARRVNPEQWRFHCAVFTALLAARPVRRR
jgi:hypothetical protein